MMKKIKLFLLFVIVLFACGCGKAAEIGEDEIGEDQIGEDEVGICKLFVDKCGNSKINIV